MTVEETTAESIALAWVYDLNACRRPTGVTRHALAQLERLTARADVDLTVVSGWIREPDGRIVWERLAEEPRPPRRIELPMELKTALRVWKLFGAPALDWWTGRVDWIYCPAELFVPARQARRAVTSHDVLQDLSLGSERRRWTLGLAFGAADRILSVSQFNTARLLEAFPECAGKVAMVPNAADELFFEPATEAERTQSRREVGLRPEEPFLLSVANYQLRKNLPRLVRAAARLGEVASGDLAIVLVGEGAADQARPIHETIAQAGPKARVLTPGYRQGPTLRALYAQATALVFASTCESFGIPAVEAMAQGCPVALADSTALPEVGGEAGWYFDPTREEAITEALRHLLDQPDERARRVELGRSIAQNFRWDRANAALLRALRGES